MRIRAVIAARAQKQLEHAVEALESRIAGDPAALRGNDQRHDSEARAADRDRVRRARALAGRAPVEGETADGMGAFPEIAERLALHDLEQRVVRQRRELRWIARRSRAARKTFAADRTAS